MGAVLAVTVLANIINNPYDDAGYSDWDFHNCMVRTNDDLTTCNAIIPVRLGQLKENSGYSSYPPLAHILGRLVGLNFLMVISVLLVYVLLDYLNGAASALLFYLVMRDWVYSMVRGGMIPFFLLIVIAGGLLLTWNKTSRTQKVLILIVGLLTHSVALPVLSVVIVTAWLYDGNIKKSAILLTIIFGLVLGYTMLFWSLEERPIWLFVFFGCLLAKHQEPSLSLFLAYIKKRISKNGANGQETNNEQ